LPRREHAAREVDHPRYREGDPVTATEEVRHEDDALEHTGWCGYGDGHDNTRTPS